MSNDLKNILSNSNKDIDNQQLMDYLSNQLSESKMHEVERSMADDAFINDAVEGLQQVENKNLANYTQQLNNELKRQLAKNKNRKVKRKWKDQPFIYFAVILIILLIIIGYLVLKQFLHSS